MECTRCGNALPAGARFCSGCGTPVPSQHGGINTGGGAFVGGSVDVKGDFVGRDQVVHGDYVRGLGGEEIARLFQDVYTQIERRPPSPDVDAGELKETVQKIEQEASKGEEANPEKTRRWLKILADAAPDVLEVTVAALTNPAAGVAAAVRAVADQARAWAK